MRDCCLGGRCCRRVLVTLVYAISLLLCIMPSRSGVSAQIYWEKLFDSLSYESNIRPVPRRDAAIGYDVGRNRLVVFGGWQTNTNSHHYRIPVLLDDTWEFNLYTSNEIFIYLIALKNPITVVNLLITNRISILKMYHYELIQSDLFN